MGETIKRKTGNREKDKNLEDLYVINSRIRLIRNIKNFQFVHSLTNKQKNEIENHIINLFNNSDFKFLTIECNNITDNDKNFYKNNFFIDENFLNRTKRFLYFEELSTVLLFNEKDHIKLIGINNGLSFNSIFKNIFKIEEFLSNNIKFSASVKYGYLSPEIKNCGLGIKFSAMIHLPGISLNEDKDAIFSDLMQRGYLVKPFYDNSFYYIISSNINFGVSEEKLVERFEIGIKNLIELDKNELFQVYNKYKENSVDTIFRSYGLLKYIKKISYEESLKNISNILIVLITDNFYCKKRINISDIINKIKDSNIINTGVNINDIDIIRGNIVRNFINSIGENNV